MRQNTDTSFNKFLYFLFFTYLLLGFFGTAWISDDFDKERIFLVTIIGIPLLSIFLLLEIYLPKWKLEFKKTFYFMIICIFLIFSWGNILLLNAVGGQEHKELVIRGVNTIALDIDKKRGAFGLIYSTRW